MNDAEERRGDTATRRRGDKALDEDAEARGDDEDTPSSPSSASPRSPIAASPLRLFCAVELSPEVRTRAAAHIARLREQLPHVRASWERDDKLHITMKFFGAVEPARAEALSLAIERATKRFAPFRLDIDGAGTFPPHAATRVLWLGVHDPNGHLARLYQALENECAIAGFKRDECRFHPHITIARLRHPAGARSLADLHRELGFPAMELPVSELVLMRSELSPQGSRYTPHSQHNLAP
jgi:2'-5' RNA ligase